ncbi:acyl-CoA/acyl-ACP dehydrogenase [Pseudomonas sp. MAFF 311096]|uniref:Acyl-CoA/acyl-ACP dehydrogenase n=2 Tax=Pseudomonas petroselini TaxID=2899822 RepID=A0ABS8QWG9_9PSED|nr:acyl-CoA dehydrogenase family protein [Pseudomonas petroselini]MCD7040090.1 acyl-CoA/acyl-ACP dehydrogenase [Pseudomonas petroselini]MCD7045005.1 acyl-CoA/acyl-ACP dehydrogenase [Pseudomonas petroselini]MCD7069852.1 acyl-CoA/acyl-ACP dehydrogenase [Pseudomonas petroselini]
MCLKEERAAAFEWIPELVTVLEAASLIELERGESKQLATLFRTLGRPGLTIAKELGGEGVSATKLAQVLTWVGAHCPSLAVMMTMHHHTVAGMMAASRFFPDIQGLLSIIARDNLLVASGFAEGRAQANILESTLSVEKTAAGYVVNGSKKPCTMTHHFDVITFGVNYLDPEGQTHIGIGMGLADDPSIQRKPFWSVAHLQAADSNEVIFNNLLVPEPMMYFSKAVDNQLDDVQQGTGEHLFAIWFQLLASASYLGMASALASRALASNKGSQDDRALLLIDLQGATMAIRGLAIAIDQNRFLRSDLARAQATRFAVQEAINRISTRAFEILGGIAFMSSEEIAYLLVATRVLAFHPTSRLASVPFLCEQLS